MGSRVTLDYPSSCRSRDNGDRMRSLPLLVLAFSPAIVLPQGTSSSLPPIIDVHLHAFDPMMLHILGVDSTTYEEYKRRSLEEIQRFNIYGFVGGPAATVREWKSELPDRIFSGFMAFNPIFPQNRFEPDSIRAMVSRDELDMIGEVAPQYLGLAPSDPKLEPLWAIAEELDIPVGYHMGPGVRNPAHSIFPGYRASLTNPLLLEEVLNRHPSLRLFVMHAGWPMFAEMVAVLHTYPNVYVGVGALNSLPDSPNYLRTLIDAGFEDRIMFGSDQMAWPEIIEQSIHGIENAEFLTEEQKRKIFYSNAVRFFGLEENPPGR